MKRYAWFVVIMGMGLALTACNEKAEVTSAPASPEVKPAAASAVDAAESGSLTGRVTFSGPAPAPVQTAIAGNPECAALHPGGKVAGEELVVSADGGVKNVFVYIKEGLEGRRFPAPQEKAVIENKGCVYVPHVIGVQTGQPVELKNEDATLHNVHSYASANKSWNIGLPFQNMKVAKTFDKPEIMVKLKCDVHPWMLGYVGVVAHPCFAVTGEDGSFTIKGIPAGEYTVEYWHEKLGVRTQTIRIEPRAETKAEAVTY